MEEKKSHKKLFLIILLIIVVIASGVIIYLTFIKKDKPKEVSQEDVEKISEKAIKLIARTPSVIPVSLNGEAPRSYTVNDLKGNDLNSIIFSYAVYISEDKTNDACFSVGEPEVVRIECSIKAKELASSVGINIGNKFTKDEYVTGIVSKNNEDYYHVNIPITSLDMEYYMIVYTSEFENNKLSIKGDVMHVIDPYKPKEEKIGDGAFVFNIKDGVTFEEFNFNSAK